MAGAGGGGLGLGSGIAQGVANALMRHRARQREDLQVEEARKQRRSEMEFPIAFKFGEEFGDWTWANEWMTRNDPELAKRLKREGSPFDVLGPMMTRSVPGKPTMVTEPIPEVPGATRQVPSGQTTLPSTQGVLATQPVSERTHFLGQRMPTAEDRARQAQDLEITGLERTRQAQIDLARRMLPQLKAIDPSLTLEDALRYVSKGELVTTPATGAAAGFTLGPEQVRYSSTGQEIARGPKKEPTSGAQSELDELVTSYARERNIPIEQVSTAERLKLRQQLSAAGRPPEQAGENVGAVAEMAATNPAILQGKTPTFQGAVIAEIAKNPALLARYEQTRMKPIRETAKQMVSALDKLLTTDAQGKVTGLTSGGQTLFGELTPVGGRDILAGVSDAFGSGGATDALAALQQVTGQQILDLIGQMKQQSQTGATGFGQLSIAELDVLTSAASQLTRRLSESAALAELTKLRDKFKKIEIPSAAEMGGPNVNLGGGDFSITHNGKTYTFQSQAQLDLFKRRAGLAAQ